MTVYILAQIDVREPKIYAEYANQVPSLVVKHGGTFIIRGGDHETLEGAKPRQRIVLISFPSRSAARAFYDDDDYQAIAAIRRRASDGGLILIEGV
ncbi:MAG: DUF1330 domain-containing protein [Geminicoccaceae bacterium]